MTRTTTDRRERTTRRRLERIGATASIIDVDAGTGLRNPTAERGTAI